MLVSLELWLFNDVGIVRIIVV